MTARAHCRRRRCQPSRAARSSALPTRAALSAGACRMLRRPAPSRANRPAPLAPPPRCFAQLAPLAHVACSTAPCCRLRRPGSRPPGDAARSTTPRHPFRRDLALHRDATLCRSPPSARTAAPRLGSRANWREMQEGAGVGKVVEATRRDQKERGGGGRGKVGEIASGGRWPSLPSGEADMTSRFASEQNSEYVGLQF
jgi:hypothetical protein